MSLDGGTFFVVEGGRILVFFGKGKTSTSHYPIKHPSQLSLVGNHLSHGLQLRRVVRLGDPEFYVSVDGVFLLHVLHKPLPLPFAVELWIVVEAELYGTCEDDVGVEVAVGLCHYTAVDAARGMGG